ncbi:MAG: hypothetical protein Q8N47_25200, partial [Bryobacterales bacterium]|nr:hypothetical protein [Bryobacterales bacterium]
FGDGVPESVKPPFPYFVRRTLRCGVPRCACRVHRSVRSTHTKQRRALFSAQPIAALDGLCAGKTEELQQGIRILDDVRSRKYLLAVVPEEDLLRWCDEEPKSRYPAIARVIAISQRTSEAGPLQWTSVALRFLEKAPDPCEVLRQFVSQFMPAGGWSGSLAAILEAHATLLDDLGTYPDLAVFVAQEKVRLHDATEAQRRSETASDKQRDERFE